MISLDTSQQRELEAPVEWILQQNTGSISSEDIAISCLSLKHTLWPMKLSRETTYLMIFGFQSVIQSVRMNHIIYS